MPKSAPARTVGRIAMAALLGAALAAPARAGDLPNSALSLSWGLDPILIDSPALLCLFPERAVAADSAASLGVQLGRAALWATTDADPWNVDEHNLGAIWRGRWFGFFVLAQPNYLVGGDLVRVGSPSLINNFYPEPFMNESDVLQAGAGARWGGMRAGLAYRATRHRSETGDRDTPSDGSVYLRGEQNAIDFRELAFGLGADFRGASVDAAFEWQDEEYEETYGASTPSEMEATILRGEARGMAGFAARIDAPVGQRLRLVAAGHYRWAERTWTGTRYESTSSQAIAFGERAKTWGAHLGLVFATRYVERLVFAGSVVRYDEPLSGLVPPELWAVTRKASRGTVTIAAEKAVWRALAVRAGVSGDYMKAEGGNKSIDDGGSRSRAEETLTDRFHWGLSYRWRGLRFEASLQAPPQIDIPFEHFDLYWSF